MQRPETQLMKLLAGLLILGWLAAGLFGYYTEKYRQDQDLGGMLIMARGVYTNIETRPNKACEGLGRLLAVHVDEYRTARRSPVRNLFLRSDPYAQYYLQFNWDTITGISIPSKDDDTGLKWKRPEPRNDEN